MSLADTPQTVYYQMLRFVANLLLTGEHESRRKSEYNATERRRTENAPRSNRLFRRNQVGQLQSVY